MNEHLLIRGKHIYIETAGPTDAPPLLFIHGGPGGGGCYDFFLYQGDG